MFLFLPVVALVLFALFGRTRRFYVEHLVLVLHVQSALFLLFSLALALGALAARWRPVEPLAGAATVAAWVYGTWYVFRALRVVYGEARGATAAKFLVLGLAYLVLLGATLAGTAVWSAFAA
jgi:hypothetical protein